jgi:hypothetical protein
MGKAKLRKTSIDIIKQNEIDKKKSFGIARNNFTGISNAGSSSLSGAINGSSAGTQQTDGFLKTSGDTMVGSIAFYPKALTVASGSISLITAIGTNVASSTSRVVVLGQGGAADNLLTINGATHAGQILFLQAVETTPITLVTGTGNIFIPSGSNYIVASKEIVLLQYDTINATWTLISPSSSSGIALSDNNVWTGINTFSGTSTSFNSPTINLGDGSTDKINFIGTAGTNLDMSDYDIDTVDRLIFSSTGSNNLATTDYGIGTDSTDANDLHYNVPTGRSHEFDVAGTQTFHISPTLVTSQVSLWVEGALTVTGDTTLKGDTTIGNSTGDDVTVTGRVNGISLNASSIHAYNSTEVGFFTKSTTGTLGTLGSIQIPYSTGGVGSAATADSHFGSDIGCMGIYTLGNPIFVIKTGASTWHALVFTSSPTTYSF